MNEYFILFETVADYTAAENTLVKPNVSLIEETNKVEYNLYIPPIIYTASEKLVETTDDWTGGIHVNAFNTTIKSHTFNEETGVGVIEFEDKLTLIGDTAGYYPGGGAFFDCTNLTSITIPNSVTSIGDSAFYNCTKLTSINIPDSVTSIGVQSFYGCSGLTSITIPDSVTTIGGSAFFDCTKLTRVTVEATTPPSLGYSAFNNNASGRKIYVPAETVDTYKSASGWSTYANDIEAIPTA